MHNYTKNDIVDTLKKAGIQSGDNVFIHSNLGFFGRMENCQSKEDLCANFFQSIQSVVGENGTIFVPTFSYSFCKGEIFEPQKTETGCGMFAEYIRNHVDSVRSIEPNFSVAGIGANCKKCLEQIGHEAFGKNSFWEKWINAGKAKLLNLNFDCGSTFVHYIEHENQVEYRYNKAFNGQMIVNGKEIRDYYVHYVYDKEREMDGPEFSRLDELCKKAGICKTEKLGRGNINVLEAEQYMDFINKILKERPRFLTKVEDI